MSNPGVIYYNKGQMCLVRLAVSLFSLRRHYSGAATILHEGKPERWITSIARGLGVQIVQIEPELDERPLVRKAQLWRWTPYELTMFIDADTLVMQPVDGFFDEIERHRFVVHRFSDWQTTSKRIAKRIDQWEEVVGSKEVFHAKALGAAINTGVFGFANGATLLTEWEEVTRRGNLAGATPIMVDELACQVILHKHPHKIVGPEWGASVKYHKGDLARIYHYHGKKETVNLPACEHWKQAYWELRNQSRFYRHLGRSFGHRRFRRYLQKCQGHDLTVVSAVTPNYLSTFKDNFLRWIHIDGLRERQFLIFANQMNARDSRLDWLAGFRNVKILPWSHEPSGSNIRERMLSAFVFGVAKEVETKYWLKIDADATPKNTAFPLEELNYTDFAITAHRWGFTRTKGDNRPGHWLNRLDHWYAGCTGEELSNRFPLLSGSERYQHSRISSFVSIERVDHTRQLAMLAGDRLPVPSQDTCSWYLAYRRGSPIQRVNMKKWFIH